MIESTNRQEQLTPEQVRNYALAAELSRRIGDNENATEFAKRSGRSEIATQMKKGLQSLELNPEIKFLFDKLMRKIIRWLTVKEEWAKQNPRGLDMFDLSEEPDYRKVIQAVGGIENFKDILAKQLGSYKIEIPKATDHPYARSYEGIQLASFENSLLLLEQYGQVSLHDKSSAIPVIPRSIS